MFVEILFALSNYKFTLAKFLCFFMGLFMLTGKMYLKGFFKYFIENKH